MCVSQWLRDKELGVKYGQDNMYKKMSNEEYLIKMNIEEGMYTYRHIE